MEAAISSVSAPQPTARTEPDVRPVADAAAIARDPQPDIPLAIPATNGQSGAVNAARLSDTTTAVTPPQSTERLLKPYGVAMLPESPAEQARDDADTPDDHAA